MEKKLVKLVVSMISSKARIDIFFRDSYSLFRFILYEKYELIFRFWPLTKIVLQMMLYILENAVD